MSESSIFSSESDRTYFPPNKEIMVTIVISDIPINDWNWICKFGNLETIIYLSETDTLFCPLCDGVGIVTPQKFCSICSSTGFVD